MAATEIAVLSALVPVSSIEAASASDVANRALAAAAAILEESTATDLIDKSILAGVVEALFAADLQAILRLPYDPRYVAMAAKRDYRAAREMIGAILADKRNTKIVREIIEAIIAQKRKTIIRLD